MDLTYPSISGSVAFAICRVNRLEEKLGVSVGLGSRRTTGEFGHVGGLPRLVDVWMLAVARIQES